MPLALMLSQTMEMEVMEVMAPAMVTAVTAEMPEPGLMETEVMGEVVAKMEVTVEMAVMVMVQVTVEMEVMRAPGG
ncbi:MULTISPECIES: hypothetical protein [Pantoea]|nr:MULTISPECIES: hypothetical protein [Pantoea]KAF6666477.1 hypothetical protein HFD92_06755 [Pantoea sp. EKM101V]